MNSELFIEKLEKILGKDISADSSFSDTDIQVVVDTIRTDNVQIEDILAISLMFAYIPYDDTKKLDEEVTKYISLNHKNIVSQLNSFPQIYNFIKQSLPNINFYDKILSSTFDGNLIEDIWSITVHHLFKCINGLYGIKYFLKKLLLVKSKEFDSWLKISNRKDLKYVLLDELLCDGGFLSLTDNDFSSSINPYIRCIHFFTIYKNSSSLENIFNSKFSTEDQLYLSLFILLFRHSIFYGGENFDLKYREIESSLNKLSQSGILQYLTKDSFNGFRSGFYNRTTIYLIIDRVEDSNTKKDLFRWLYESIFEKDLYYINEHSILLANVIIKTIEGDITLLSDLKKRYKKICQKTLFPYAYDRNPKDWYPNIMMQLFLTIVLVMSNPDDKDLYILNLKSARTRRHIQDELINGILDQLNSNLT